jgi:hypothetical protein
MLLQWFNLNLITLKLNVFCLWILKEKCLIIYLNILSKILVFGADYIIFILD